METIGYLLAILASIEAIGLLLNSYHLDIRRNEHFKWEIEHARNVAHLHKVRSYEIEVMEKVKSLFAQAQQNKGE